LETPSLPSAADVICERSLTGYRAARSKATQKAWQSQANPRVAIALALHHACGNMPSAPSSLAPNCSDPTPILKIPSWFARSAN